jgi:hypothetical protein
MLNLFKDRPLSKEISDKIIAKRKAMVRKLRDISKEQGKLLFEGKWLAPNEVKEYYNLMKTHHRQIFAELMGLFIVILGLTAFLGLILLSLCG